MENNRKLAKMAQGIIIKNKDNFNHTNIRNLTGAIKDIENVANPTTSSTNITNTNAQQTNNKIEIMLED